MKWWFIGISVLLFITVSLGVFYNTGGRGLVRIVQHYLLKDIPDKKLTGSDFIPNSTTHKVSGFYSAHFSNPNIVAIWTLVGLRRYHNLSAVSVYYHRDVCALVAAVKDKNNGIAMQVQSEAREYSHDALLNIIDWQSRMKSEYMVTVEWVEEDGKPMIKNLWSVSGKYRIPGRVGDGVCE